MSTDKKFLSYDIDKRHFNPLFFEMWNAPYKRFMCSMGGSGSGKSHSITQREILKCLQKKEKLLVVRKVAATLKNSVIEAFVSQLNDWNIPFKQNLTDRTIKFENGSSILFLGISDSERLKSIKGVTRCFIEEATELDEEDLLEINRRIRGAEIKDPQITLAWNPVSDSHWLRTHFFSEDDAYSTDRDDTIVFHSTYKDNNFLDEDYGEQLEQMKNINYVQWDIYANGKWGRPLRGDECFRFDTKVNDEIYKSEKYFYDHMQPLWVSFDENLRPYVTIIVAQMFEGNVVVVDEICEEGKNLNEALGVFKRRFADHQSGVIVTGDATSKKGDTKLERGANFYTIIADELKEFHPTIKVPKSNQNVYLSILFMNKLLNDGKFVINPKCKKAIDDFVGCPWDKDGTGKDKTYVSKKINGQTIRYQQWGHTSDASTYLCVQYFYKEFLQFKSRTKSHTIISEQRVGRRW